MDPRAQLPAFECSVTTTEQFRYQDRSAATDIAFCVAAFSYGMTEDQIERALENDYLTRYPSTSKRAAYICRIMEKARR
jgi:hypothetical protein